LRRLAAAVWGREADTGEGGTAVIRSRLLKCCC